MNDYIVKKQIAINAQPSEVWDALTNPEKTKKYFFHCEVFSSWQPGEPITFKGKLFLIKNIEMTGTILNIEPGKFLQYTIRNQSDENPANFSTVTDTLEYAEGKTILSVTDDVGAADGAKDRYEKSLKGWDKVLSGLKELVEEKETV